MCAPRTAGADDDDVLVGWNQPEGNRVPPVVASVALIADDGVWRDRTAGFLASEGFVVVVDASGDIAFDGRARAADAVLIDLALATRSATDVCVAWRSRSGTPILAVSSIHDEAVVLDAYAAGADHVASIDITPRQLLARLRSMLRRVPARREHAADTPGEPSPVLLDAGRHAVLVQGTKVDVTSEEYEFLELLIRRSGRVVARSELNASVHGSATNERALDSFVRRLREKLESVDGQRRILVVRGVGFRFEAGTARIRVPDVLIDEGAKLPPAARAGVIPGSRGRHQTLVPSAPVAREDGR